VLNRDASVDVRVYDVAGELVRDLGARPASRGPNEAFWDSRNDAGAAVASGVFLGRISATVPGEERDAWVKMAILR
jgi:flagellar hook assembly protein FlgD